MIPIFQDRLYNKDCEKHPPGNCWSACIASILELELKDLPDELEFWKPGMKYDESWPKYVDVMIQQLNEWNLTLLEVNINSPGCIDSYSIISGPSPRNQDILHACVGKCGKIVHDPHPSGDGLLKIKDKPWTYTYFIIRDPSLIKRHVYE